jgi:hypothetical protein
VAVADSTEVIRRSVTAGDVNPNIQAAGLWNFVNIQLGSQDILLTQALPDLGLTWAWDQDFTLSRTVLYQGDWAAAIGIAITKMSSLAWQSTATDDTSRLRTARANEMFHAANFGKGWVNFLAQHLRDFLTCCNGSHIEIVRATQGYGAKIIGLCHLDSRRCRRTGNPEVPILYRDRLGAEHELKWYQVISLSDMPDPADSFFDVGLSAAYRAYDRIRFQAVVDRYLIEKVSGFRSNALVFLNGISDTQLKSAILMGDEDRKRKGAYTYRGATMIPVVDAEKFEKMVVELASLPDGFVYKDELATTMQKYANAIGLDVQDLMPLSGQGFGTGWQSEVLASKSKGRGLSSWQADFTHLMNTFVLPDQVVFAFSEKDVKDELSNAQVLSAQIGAVTTAVTAGVLTALEAKQILADMKAIPNSMLPQDDTPSTTLSSEEKPEAVDDTQPTGDNANATILHNNGQLPGPAAASPAPASNTILPK